MEALFVPSAPEPAARQVTLGWPSIAQGEVQTRGRNVNTVPRALEPAVKVVRLSLEAEVLACCLNRDIIIILERIVAFAHGFKRWMLHLLPAPLVAGEASVSSKGTHLEVHLPTSYVLGSLQNIGESITSSFYLLRGLPLLRVFL